MHESREHAGRSAQPQKEIRILWHSYNWYMYTHSRFKIFNLPFFIPPFFLSHVALLFLLSLHVLCVSLCSTCNSFLSLMCMNTQTTRMQYKDRLQGSQFHRTSTRQNIYLCTYMPYLGVPSSGMHIMVQS